MKKLNLLLIPLLFSSLLMGCGMPGPLYRAQKTQVAEKQPITQKTAKMVEENSSAPSCTAQN